MSQMSENLIEDVGFARDFQESARNSKVIKFADKTIELALFKINPDELVVVESTINSPKTIKSVNVYGEEFIAKCL